MSRNISVKQIEEKLVSFLISPWLLALPVAIIIILFLPHIEKYKIELVRKGVCDKPESFVIFSDLDGDGFGEKVMLFNNQKGEAAVKVLNQSNVLIGWWDFKGSIYKDAPKPGDYNHDGKPEIYFISNHHDSLFLNILCPTSNKNHISKQRFITLTHIENRENDYTAGNWQFCDLQMDGFDEIMFTILAGYSLQPRRLFAYDQKHDTLLMGPVMGCQTYFIPTQLDDDPYVELIGQTSSTGNISPEMNIPFRDSSSWFMVLDHHLNFIFGPVEFKGHKTSLECQSVLYDNNYNILSLFEFSSVNSWKPTLILFDSYGNLIKKRELEKQTGQVRYSLLFNHLPGQEKIFLHDDAGLIYRIDQELNLKKIAKIPENSSSYFESFDLDNDGSIELVSLCNDFERIYIIRNDFAHIADIKIPFERAKYHFSVQENGKDAPFLFVQRGDREMWFSYGFNKLWYAKFPIWLGIYFFVLTFIYLIRNLQIIQQRKVKAREDRLAELQLGAVSTYLDPHFTFNTLNTITSLIYKEEKVKAHEVITRFTSLIRTTLMQAGKVSRSLKEELEFVKNYLEIQQFRFGKIFTWEIKNEDNIDLTLPVPKMMVQQYAENAIKHGLKNKGADGRLEIILHQQHNETQIFIRDNGVGREKAKTINEPGTGKGLITMQQVFDLFQKTHKIQITQTIKDLKDDSGNPSGTEVILTIRKL